MARSMPKRIVIDSSVIIALNSEGKLESQLGQWVKEGYESVIPRAVAEEVIDEPLRWAKKIRGKIPAIAEKIDASVNKIENAIEHGLIKQEKVNYRKYSKVMDNVRRHLSSFEAKPEHAIKKGDPELIALVIQLFEEKQEKVFASTFDKGLLKALKPFSDKVEYEVMKI
jgi:predicted nucleic acid-binding protein